MESQIRIIKCRRAPISRPYLTTGCLYYVTNEQPGWFFVKPVDPTKSIGTGWAEDCLFNKEDVVLTTPTS